MLENLAYLVCAAFQLPHSDEDLPHLALYTSFTWSMAERQHGSTEVQSQRVFTRGIYHGLPDLSTHAGLTAVVSGANGISGAHMVRVLAENPTRWNKIYALSRRPPSGSWPKTVVHVPVDFMENPETIADILRKNDIRPDYIFFFSYVLIVDDNGALQWGDQRLVDKNSETRMNSTRAMSTHKQHR